MKKLLLFVTILQVIFAFPSAEKNPKVVGGRDAQEHEAPYIVSLQFDRLFDGNFQHVCGGSIINTIWVLSAAHCITEVGLQFTYQVVAGQHDLAVSSENEQSRRVDEHFIHENFVSGPVVGPFDIMLLRLESPLQLIRGVIETINLPPRGAISSGDATLFGWGSTSDTSTPSFPNILQTVTKPIIPWDLCQEVVDTVMNHAPLHSSNLCTGPLDTVQSACNG
jgi:secreted trypsin-like serine protease